jgi:hypothetical protein
MANRGYLINTSSLTSDPDELARLRDQPGHVDGVVAEGSGRVSIPWFLCFRQSDVRMVPWREGRLPLPCTTVEQATRNLEESLPVFEAIAGDPALAQPYWSLACALVRRLPLPYLALSPIEVLDMDSQPVEAIAAEIMGALSGDLSAVPHLKSLAEYQDDAPAYPLEVLYSVPTGIDRYGSRTWNATVLDGGFQPNFEYVIWNKASDTAAPEAPPPLPQTAFGALYDVKGLLDGWIKEEVPSAPGGGMGILPGPPESLVVDIYACSDADAKQLEASPRLRQRLETLANERLEPWCRGHSFGWEGFRFSSPAWTRR